MKEIQDIPTERKSLLQNTLQKRYRESEAAVSSMTLWKMQVLSSRKQGNNANRIVNIHGVVVIFTAQFY